LKNERNERNERNKVSLAQISTALISNCGVTMRRMGTLSDIKKLAKAAASNDGRDPKYKLKDLATAVVRLIEYLEKAEKNS
jgi:hypothetical protein